MVVADSLEIQCSVLTFVIRQISLVNISMQFILALKMLK